MVDLNINDYPSDTTTGVRDGVTLTNSGSITVSASGTVISGLNITGDVIITGNNVTLQDCHISGNVSVIGTGNTIQYCDIVGSGVRGVGATDGIDINPNGVDGQGANTTIRFCDISKYENGIWLESHGCMINDNFIHNLTHDDPDGHYDGIQVPGTNIGATPSHDDSIIHNRTDLDLATATSSFISLDAYNMTMSDNWFSGGAATVYWLHSHGIQMTNNVIAAYAYEPLDDEGSTGNTYSGNTDSNGNLYSFNNSTSGATVSVSDVTITEGNSGTKLATFTITRTGSTAAFAVNYATSDGTATVADNDYVAVAGLLNFADGQNTQTVSVTINGDTKSESNETFNFDLSNATNGVTIGDGHGVGTITNDDAAAVAGSVSINDVSTVEGNSGSHFMTFTVTRTGGTAAFDVHYATSNGTAKTGNNDYTATSGTLHFADGQNTQTLTVSVKGDLTVEGNETFNVNLSNATNGATISDNLGIGTITNDDTAGGTNLVTNGGFETANFAGWTKGGNTAGIFTAPTDFSGPVHGGTKAAGFGSFDTDGSISQTITTVAGQHYTLDFWTAVNSGGSSPHNHFVATWDGAVLFEQTNAANSGYVHHTYDVVGDGSSVLQFAGYNNPDAWFLDDVRLLVV